MIITWKKQRNYVSYCLSVSALHSLWTIEKIMKMSYLKYHEIEKLSRITILRSDVVAFRDIFIHVIDRLYYDTNIFLLVLSYDCWTNVKRNNISVFSVANNKYLLITTQAKPSEVYSQYYNRQIGIVRNEIKYFYVIEN